MNEAEHEAEMQAKAKHAPRIKPEDIDATIVAEQFYIFPGTQLTVCALSLRNGFVVTGESAPASPENYDREIGEKLAREKAREKIWTLEGYLLRQRLSHGAA